MYMYLLSIIKYINLNNLLLFFGLNKERNSIY